MKTRYVVILIVLIVLSFMAGQQYQPFYYDNLCLDIVGGRHPDNYPICVLIETHKD